MYVSTHYCLHEITNEIQLFIDIHRCLLLFMDISKIIYQCTLVHKCAQCICMKSCNISDMLTPFRVAPMRREPNRSQHHQGNQYKKRQVNCCFVVECSFAVKLEFIIYVCFVLGLQEKSWWYRVRLDWATRWQQGLLHQPLCADMVKV